MTLEKETAQRVRLAAIERCAIELAALHGGIGCGLGGASVWFEKKHLSLSDFRPGG